MSAARDLKPWTHPGNRGAEEGGENGLGGHRPAKANHSPPGNDAG